MFKQYDNNYCKRVDRLTIKILKNNASRTHIQVNQKGLLDKKIFKDKMSLLAPPTILSILLPVIEECVVIGNHTQDSNIVYTYYNVVIMLVDFYTDFLDFRQECRDLSVFVQLHKVCVPRRPQSE